VPNGNFTSAQNVYALIAVSIANALSAKLNAIHVRECRFQTEGPNLSLYQKGTTLQLIGVNGSHV
jgi:hypothetical protein